MRSPCMKSSIHNPYHKEGGAVLVVGLIILGVLMMGALAMMQTSVQDERIVSNKRMQTQAFLTAERGLLHAQQQLNDKSKGWKTSNCLNDPDIKDGDVLTVNGESFIDIPMDENNPGIGGYTITVAGCTDAASLPELTSTAVLSGARVDLKAEYQPPKPPAIDLGDPPAPVSCFNGACNIANGAGHGAGIFGQDHIPKTAAFHCKGQAHCRESSISYLVDDTRPAIYQEEGGTVTSKKGQSEICGANSVNAEEMTISNQTCYGDKSNDLDFGAIWGKADYENSGHYKNEKGESIAPDFSNYFGEGGVDPYSDVEFSGKFVSPPESTPDDDIYDFAKAVKLSGDQEIDLEGGVGVLLLEGNDTEIKQTGTGVFVGVVVIRQCASFSIGGNFTIVGAVIVDARKANGEPCDQPYSPFAEGGAPTVYFSSSAGRGVSGLFPPGGPGSLNSWQQFTES